RNPGRAGPRDRGRCPRGPSPYSRRSSPRLDPSVQGSGVEVFPGDELVPGRVQRALVDATAGWRASDKNSPPSVGLDGTASNSTFPPGTSGCQSGRQDVDRADGLRHAAVLLQTAPRVERNRPGLPECLETLGNPGPGKDTSPGSCSGPRLRQMASSPSVA